MENNKYPFFHKLFTAKQTKRKSQNRNDKTCKRFCKNIFLPERERVEMEFAKKYKMKYITPTKNVKEMFLKSCNDIYCQKKCKGIKNKWSKTFTKKRKDKLIQQGAVSGCRDLHKEFPEYYKNI